MFRKTLLTCLLSLFVFAPAQAETKPVKIGDMFAYTSLASEGVLYRKGWEHKPFVRLTQKEASWEGR